PDVDQDSVLCLEVLEELRRDRPFRAELGCKWREGEGRASALSLCLGEFVQLEFLLFGRGHAVPSKVRGEGVAEEVHHVPALECGGDLELLVQVRVEVKSGLLDVHSSHSCIYSNTSYLVKLLNNSSIA